jgi:hypothetical protein
LEAVKRLREIARQQDDIGKAAGYSLRYLTMRGLDSLEALCAEPDHASTLDDALRAVALRAIEHTRELAQTPQEFHSATIEMIRSGLPPK